MAQRAGTDVKRTHTTVICQKQNKDVKKINTRFAYILMFTIVN